MKILTEKGIREIISISLDDSRSDKFFIVAEWLQYTYSANGFIEIWKEPVAYFPIRQEWADDDARRAYDTFDEIKRDIIENDIPKIFELYTNCHSIPIKCLSYRSDW